MKIEMRIASNRSNFAGYLIDTNISFTFDSTTLVFTIDDADADTIEDELNNNEDMEFRIF